MTFIADSIRLPKDPPRIVDVKRLTAGQLIKAATTSDFDVATKIILQATGIPNTDLLTEHLLSRRTWYDKSWENRLAYLTRWLIMVDHDMMA